MNRSSVARITFALSLALSLAPSLARAELPSCNGSDTGAATRARAEGLRRYRTATSRAEINRVEMAAALEAFNAQCRAGDVNALEMRAYALAALGRGIEAAESLDVFLAARPLHTLDDDARARVGAQRGAILAQVGTVAVEGDLPNSNVVVNGRPYGALPQPSIRVAPGEISVQVFAPTLGSPVVRTFRVAAGETRTEVIEAPAQAATANATGTPTNTGGTNNTQPPPLVTEPPVVGRPPPSRGAPIVPIVLGVSGLAVAGGFVGATLWHGNRVSEFETQCRPTTPDIADACNAVQSEQQSALIVQIATGVVAGGLIIGSAISLGLWFANAPRTPRTDSPEASAPQARVRVACAPLFGAQTQGVSCLASF
ncbi:MAG: hypothetical protein Q8Q09_25195 [Deltaproteobacteria bacterium]|nr:hypothetical protein [Deltaproteobacteria bacterium]